MRSVSNLIIENLHGLLLRLTCCSKNRKLPPNKKMWVFDFGILGRRCISAVKVLSYFPFTVSSILFPLIDLWGFRFKSSPLRAGMLKSQLATWVVCPGFALTSSVLILIWPLLMSHKFQTPHIPLYHPGTRLYWLL